jgi:hypothetical protein
MKIKIDSKQISTLKLSEMEERREEEKEEIKETNGERKRVKVEKVKKVDLEEGTTTVTILSSKITTQCLALFYSLWRPERSFGSTRKRGRTKEGKREEKRERTREKDQGEKGKQVA